MPRWPVALTVVGVVTALAGCGSRTPVPRVTRPAPPGGFLLRRYAQAGFGLARPRSWIAVATRPPLVALVTSGPAVISLWRYPHAGPGPGTPVALHQAEVRLIAAARSRNRTVRLLSSDTTSVAGYPAVELLTEQAIGGLTRRVQSIHLYRRGEEVVLEEYAPPSLFGALDRAVFSIVRRSLTPLGR